jgi:hypothetical protein
MQDALGDDPPSPFRAPVRMLGTERSVHERSHLVGKA